MLLNDYVTKSEITRMSNKTVAGFWPIGIDYGYSSVKGFAPNKKFCFPNCALKVDSFDSLLDSTEKDLLLKDEQGLWIVGARAHDIITPESAMNYESEMYERNRYFSPAFRALMKVGLGIAVLSNPFMKYEQEEIVIQTGLPPEYRLLDSEAFKDSLAGDYDFELKIGKGPFRHINLSIKADNIHIMDQPMGSLFSSIINNNGEKEQSGIRILKSNTLVMDPGFKTFDLYNISGGMCKGSNTFDSLGMHEIFRRTIDDVKKQYGTNLTVLGMQDALRRGYITSFDRRRMASRKITFDEELMKNTKEVCMEAVNKILSLYNYLQNHDYMIVTGGTGNAWYPIVKEFFKDMDNLTILSANRNDTSISNTYSNVRGYYCYLVGMIEKVYKK